MKRRELCVLYIPGLGDANITGQRFAVRVWRLWGVHTEVWQMHWATDEAWSDKLDHLLTRVDKLLATYENVAIVGVSAGASAAINVYAMRRQQIVGCALIAGKIHGAPAIGENYRQENPAFFDSVRTCEQAVASLTEAELKRILSRYAVFDTRLQRSDSYIAGANNRVVPTIGHTFTIAVQILFGAPSFLSFLKAQSIESKP